jgi:hypothetical protein
MWARSSWYPAILGSFALVVLAVDVAKMVTGDGEGGAAW